METLFIHMPKNEEAEFEKIVFFLMVKILEPRQIIK